MATGQVPFEAETPLAVVVKHIRDPLPVPSRVNPDIPEPLQRMIFRAMHKEPSERFPTASAMVEAMSTMTGAPPQPAELTATVPIGGVPPLPTAATDGSRGVDDGWLWTNADAYCEGLTLGSTSNWQLPSREELDPVLQRLDPARYPWGLSLWSASRPFGEANRLWVTNSPLSAPEWSSTVRDASARRLTHRAVCVAHPEPR